jgi:hypothetical protein
MNRMLLGPTVRKYAAFWKLTDDGVSRKGTMPVNNWRLWPWRKRCLTLPKTSLERLVIDIST